MVSFQSILGTSIREHMHVNCLPSVCGRAQRSSHVDYLWQNYLIRLSLLAC